MLTRVDTCNGLELKCHICGATVKVDSNESTVRFICRRADDEVAEELMIPPRTPPSARGA
jgi:hypothetical protein